MKLLFIIGMQRSGTSVLTSYIETLGYNIGKNRNQDKDWQNPKGYWLNENGRWWERDPILVTSYAILTLERIYYSL